MDETLSIYIIRIEGSSYYTLAQFSSEFHTWVQFSLKGELFEGDMMRGMEEVFPYAAFCVCVVQLHEDSQKGTREKEVNHHY